MIWMYRLQQRLAITKTEANILLAFTLFLFLGFGWRYVQAQQYPSVAGYAQAEQQLAAATEVFQNVSLAHSTPAAQEVHPTITPIVADSQRTAEPIGRAPSVARMNINRATASQLERLPRIGPKMAERILTYRNTHGAFKRVKDLTNVRGIGEKTLAKLKPFVFVETAQ